MSHFSRLKTKMVEKEFLLQALKDLGYSYEEGDLHVRGFGGNDARVDIKIPLRVSYDIGFRQDKEGYTVIADWFGVRGINQKDFVNKVSQRYAYHATRARLEQQGFALVEEKNGEQGQVRMVLRRMA